MINETKFNAARAALVAADIKYSDYRRKLEQEYGPTWLTSCSITENKRLDRLDAAYSRASDRLFKILVDSPRDWTCGVPCRWVELDLTYADAVKPKTESLSFVPPLSYGSTVPMK